MRGLRENNLKSLQLTNVHRQELRGKLWLFEKMRERAELKQLVGGSSTEKTQEIKQVKT